MSGPRTSRARRPGYVPVRVAASPARTGWPVLFNGVALPHDVVAVQVRRAITIGVARIEWRPFFELWLRLRCVRPAARAVGMTARRAHYVLDHVLGTMWAKDQRTNPGEVWCDEQDGAMARTGT